MATMTADVQPEVKNNWTSLRGPSVPLVLPGIALRSLIRPGRPSEAITALDMLLNKKKGTGVRERTGLEPHADFRKLTRNSIPPRHVLGLGGEDAQCMSPHSESLALLRF